MVFIRRSLDRPAFRVFSCSQIDHCLNELILNRLVPYPRQAIDSMAPPNASRRVLLIAGITILCLAFLANLWTILVFPSWFDEAFFANISFNLYRGMGRTLDLIPDYFAGSVNTYGPLYFDLQSILIRINGLHPWIFRLPNLASGYLAIAILYCVLRLHNVNKSMALLFGLACSLDVSVNRVLVSGRMDFLSVLFVSAALLMVSIRSTRLNMRLIFFLHAQLQELSLL